MGWAEGPVTVRVPATSANLGPGFDALGLALTLHDEVEARILPAGVSIEITGEGADLADVGEEHLVLRAMRATFAITGGQPPGIRLRCRNHIPHGRGLGSSAAAIVAGILAARALRCPTPDAHPAPDAPAAPHTPPAAAQQPAPPAPGTPPALDLLDLACELEGHPDNVAACLGGGLTIAWMTPDGPRMLRLEPHDSVTPVICVAPEPVRTHLARGLLPELIPHQDAAVNAGRSALLIAALTQPGTRPEVLLAATRDLLHQDYRATAMPPTHDLLGRLRAAGLPAVVSGAGPSVLALLGPRGGQGYRDDLDRLGSIVTETGIAWHVSSLDVERQGARVLPTQSPPGC